MGPQSQENQREMKAAKSLNWKPRDRWYLVQQARKAELKKQDGSGDAEWDPAHHAPGTPQFKYDRTKNFQKKKDEIWLKIGSSCIYWQQSNLVVLLLAYQKSEIFTFIQDTHLNSLARAWLSICMRWLCFSGSSCAVAVFTTTMQLSRYFNTHRNFPILKNQGKLEVFVSTLYFYMFS